MSNMKGALGLLFCVMKEMRFAGPLPEEEGSPGITPGGAGLPDGLTDGLVFQNIGRIEKILPKSDRV